MDTPASTASVDERIARLEREIAELKRQRRGVSLLCFSGEYDRLYAAFTIALGAASMGLSTEIFFTFWGAHAMGNILDMPCGGRQNRGIFGRLMPRSVNRLPLSRMNFWGLGAKLLRRMMRRKRVDDLEALIERARRMNVAFHFCDTTSQLLGFSVCTKDGADHAGVATFLARSLDRGVVLFI